MNYILRVSHLHTFEMSTSTCTNTQCGYRLASIEYTTFGQGKAIGCVISLLLFAMVMKMVIQISHGCIGGCIGIGFIDILYHNVIIPNVYRSKTLRWNT